MPRRPIQIGVRIVGTRFPRFVIVNNRRQFWGGGDWTTNLRKAVLYADAWLVQRDAEELKQKNCS